MQNLSEWYQRVSSLHVLVVGDAMLDEYIGGESSRLAAEAPVPVVLVRDGRVALGGAANSAANITSLGGHATLIGLAATDAAGATLSELCAGAGVRFVRLSDGRPTTRKVRVNLQERQVIRLDYEEASPIAETLEDRLLSQVARELPETDIVIVSDYAKGVITRTVCGDLVAMARAAGIPVLVDPRPQHGAWYRGCTFMTPNWVEGHALLGEREAQVCRASVIEAGRRLVDAFACDIVLTLGSHGLAYFRYPANEPIIIPAIACEHADVSGAGDTVAAVFALSVAAGCAQVDAAVLANHAAGIVVGKRGTVTVNAEDLWQTVPVQLRPEVLRAEA